MEDHRIDRQEEVRRIGRQLEEAALRNRLLEEAERRMQAQEELRQTGREVVPRQTRHQEAVRRERGTQRAGANLEERRDLGAMRHPSYQTPSCSRDLDWARKAEVQRHRSEGSHQAREDSATALDQRSARGLLVERQRLCPQDLDHLRIQVRIRALAWVAAQVQRPWAVAAGQAKGPEAQPVP